MPQFDAPMLGPQLFWLAVCFGILYFIMSAYVLPRMASLFEERRDKIADDVDMAQKLQSEAERACESYESELANARLGASALIAKKRAELGKENDKKRAVLAGKLSEKEREAIASLEKTGAKAMQQANEISGGLVGEIVDRICYLSEKGAGK
ncbi:MAG: hypothetical protein ACR2N8_00385 [Parvibaculales bacterium]